MDKISGAQLQKGFFCLLLHILSKMKGFYGIDSLLQFGPLP